MVAGGLPQERPRHCQAIAGLALDMMGAVADERWPDGTAVALRIGIHTGPLIAGIIGETRFVYDLWGDTVNAASRMESEAEPGRIQVSERAWEILREAFALEPRGTVQIKGKEPMRAWYLAGRSA